MDPLFLAKKLNIVPQEQVKVTKVTYEVELLHEFSYEPSLKNEKQEYSESHTIGTDGSVTASAGFKIPLDVIGGVDFGLSSTYVKKEQKTKGVRFEWPYNKRGYVYQQVINTHYSNGDSNETLGHIFASGK